MSASEPGDIIPESSKYGVVPKFDMHIHVSTLTSKELKEAIDTYGIPTDLIPRLPDLDLTMDKLLVNAIGVYVEQLEQGETRIPFLTFLLAVIKHFRVHISQLVPIGVNKGHWFSFENKPGKRAKKCFREIIPSLKGWKKKFFLVDRRAIPDAMAWRDKDTDVFDDFPISYNETHANMMAKKICENHHKDPKRRGNSFSLSFTVGGQEVTIDDYLCLPNWTGSVKIFESVEKKEKQALIKIKAKRADESRVDGPNKKKKKTRKDVRSKSENTISLEPLHKSCEFKKRTEGRYGSTKKYAEIPVVDLSDPTKDKSPPLNEMVQNGPSIGHENNQPDHENPSGANSFHSASGHHSDDDAAIGCFVPNCSTLAQAEPLKRFEQVNHGYLDLVNLHEGCHALADRLSDFGNAYERQIQLYEGLSKKFQLLRMLILIKKLESDLGPKSLRLQEAEERIRHLEKEKKVLIAHLAKSDMARHNVVNKLIPKVVSKLLSSVEYNKSLPVPGSKAWRTKYDELFTMKYPYVRKVADSHTLPFEELMKITPEVSSAPAKTVAENVKSSDPSVPVSSVQAHPEDQVNTHE
ncbi:hypothetical protein Tco_1380983 [Tanacetum coccineum]